MGVYSSFYIWIYSISTIVALIMLADWLFLHYRLERKKNEPDLKKVALKTMKWISFYFIFLLLLFGFFWLFDYETSRDFFKKISFPRFLYTMLLISIWMGYCMDRFVPEYRR